MTRTKPLPRARATGPLVVPSHVLDSTVQVMRNCRGDDGPHEALVFWLGRRIGNDTYVLSAIAPQTEHEPRRVTVDRHEVGAVGRTARQRRLAIVAQVHSHPGDGSYHSDGDDDLILMPHEGMFSLVVAHYGRSGFASSTGFSIHQFKDGRWVLVDNPQATMIVLDPLLHTDG